MIRLCKKDLLLFLKDRRSVFLSFLLPMALISLFAMAFGNMGSRGGSANPIELPVADLDQSLESKAIVAHLDTTPGLRIEPGSLEEVQEKVRKGKRIAALVFEKGFSEAIDRGLPLPMSLQFDKAREMEMGILQSILMGELMGNVGQASLKKKVREDIRNKYSTTLDSATVAGILADVESQFSGGDSGGESSLSPDMDLQLTPLVGEEQKKNDPGLIQAVAGTAILMLLFSVTGLGGSLLEEKEKGTLKKLLYSPIRPVDILFGKLLAGLVVSISQLTIMLLFAWLVFGLSIFMDIPSLLLLVIATAFACTSFGIFLAAVCKTRQQVQSLSMIVILVMSAVGGSMIPLFIMPAFMRSIAHFTVNYWSIQGFFDIFWRELPLVEILPGIGILLGIGLLMTFLSVRLFRSNILQLV